MNIYSLIKQNNFDETISKNHAICLCNLKKSFVVEKGKKFLGEYLHIIYPGLNENLLNAFKSEIGIKLPDEFISFLKENNGTYLFSGSLCVYGFGKILKDEMYVISRDINIKLPFHLYNENECKINEENIIVGSCMKSKIYLNNITRKYTWMNNTWDKIETCIYDLYNKLSVHYNDKGVVDNPIILGNIVFNKPNTL